MKQRNIVLINCDDLGYGDLGCYGSELNHTPNIDRLAREGMLFTDFYMASPVCSPSRGAMLTGCYPPRIGFGTFEGKAVLFPGQGVGLSDGETTIASVLQQAGYATMIVGKWHCGDQREFMPLRHGFDHYYGLPYSNDMGKQMGSEDMYCPLPLVRDEDVIQEQPDLCALTERYTEKAVEFIRENKDRSFFLYFAHMYVHLPHYAPEHFMRRSCNGDFGAVMECLDWSVGALMDELKQNGLDENTLVIFTSDNGGRATHGGSNGPLRGAKQQTWEGGMRVPCIMRQPGTIPAGSFANGMACSLDFFSTFCAVAGIDHMPKNKIDSLDMSGFLQSPQTEKNPRETFFYYRQNNLEAVRHGAWKLKLLDNQQPVQYLFDLRSDPGESNNLFGERPDIVEELNALMEACRDDLGDDYSGVHGANRRAIGRIENPHTLTQYDENHPYIIAFYDKGDRG